MIRARLGDNVLTSSRSLSFYKETLQGETDTYIHLRAAAEQKEPMAVLRELVEETLDNIRNIEALTSTDQQLADICRRHLMVSAS